ncbi:MAG: hypothetical protein OHK0045_22000 [Raineya sp.]
MKVCKSPKKTAKLQVIRLGLLQELEAYLQTKYIFVLKEYRFDSKRLWRFDYAIVDEAYKIAIEVEGGIYSNGRHTRGSGYQKDLHKYNNATKLGWKVYRFSYNDLLSKNYKNYV